MDCGSITSCGDGGCGKCKGKIVPSKIAGEHGHWGRCDKCFAKLPEGTKSEYIISYEKDLANVNDELSDIVVKKRELEKREKHLQRRKELLEEDLAKYSV